MGRGHDAERETCGYGDAVVCAGGGVRGSTVGDDQAVADRRADECSNGYAASDGSACADGHTRTDAHVCADAHLRAN
jgi:hypothetical protein